MKRIFRDSNIQAALAATGFSDRVRARTTDTRPLTDWRPTTGYAVNNGTAVPVLRDFNMTTRVGGTYDLGAVLT